MFDYSNDEGFLYARDLLSDYLGSDYNEFKSGKIELNEEEFKKVLKSKSFKEFLITREGNYTFVSSILSERSYNYEDGFGKLLEINPGRYEIVSNTKDYHLTEPYILTKYNDPLFFKHDEEVYSGDIDVMEVKNGEDRYTTPIIRGESKLSVSDFDTIIYLNKIEVMKMLSLLKYALDHDTYVITGLVTDVFDKHAEDKIKNIDALYKMINNKTNKHFDLLEEESCGSIVKLIHTMK